MKLPSLHVLAEETRRTLRRFPAVLAVAAIGTVAALILAGNQEEPIAWEQMLIRLLMSAALGISLLIALTVTAERRATPRWLPPAAQLGGVFLLAAYFFTLPRVISTAGEVHILRFVLLLLGSHLLVSALPFSAGKDGGAFWEFNKTLFLRVLTAGLYTLVLYAGLAVALLAVQNLFGLSVPEARYLQLWILLVGMFATWMFLAGVPRDPGTAAREQAYPKALKVFTQYVLIPIVLIYLVILYAYTVKIILDWEWPVGWVAYLVLGFSITGLFSMLVVHPVLDQPGNGFIRAFARRYVVALLPMLVLLHLAIWRRISEYGITERRYFVLALAVWLTGVVLYLLLSRKKSIRVIPASLCVLAFGVSFGPWGAFAVSERSQVARLTEYLTAQGILVEGKVRRAETEVTGSDAREITSLLRYLDETHGYSSIRSWFNVDPDTLGGVLPGETPRENISNVRTRAIAALMGVRYTDEWRSAGLRYDYFSAPRRAALSVEGYDRIVHLEFFGRADVRRALEIYGREWEMRYRSARSALILSPADAPADSVVLDLQAFAAALERERHAGDGGDPPSSRMVLDVASGPIRFRLLLSVLETTVERDSVRFAYGRADLLIGRTAEAQAR